MAFRSRRTLIPGTQVAGYHIEKELGRGAMAVVYLAVQLNLERRVALKILAEELAANQEFVVRFFNEARAAAALSHPHIIQAYDAGISSGNIHYFAMEFVDGETLLQRTQRQGYLRPAPGLQLAIHIADALNYGWQRQRLTHGDIKPENVMINGQGQSKLADFGLAKVVEHDFDGSDIMLTPLYAAPEVIRGEDVRGDCRSDIYSFGATLYHMFAGSPPYPGDRAQEVLDRHLYEAMEPLRERNPAMPGSVSDMVGQFLAKDASERPGTWTEVTERLQDVARHLAHPGVVIKPARPIGRIQDRVGAGSGARSRRRKRSPWAVVFAAAAALGLAALLFTHLQDTDSKRDDQAPDPRETVPATDPTSAGDPQYAGNGWEAPGPSSWSEIQQRLSQEDDPQRALELLQAFQQNHRQRLPENYDAVLASYEEAAGNQIQPFPDDQDVLSAGNETQVSSATRSEAADFPDAGVGARSAEFGSGAGEAPAPVSAARRQGAGTAGKWRPDDAGPIHIPVPSDVALSDSAMLYLSRLARTDYRIPMPVEAPMRAAQEWLLTYPDPSAEKEHISFAARTVLPSLEEVLPKLVARGTSLSGRRLPGKAYADSSLFEVTMDGLVLRERVTHGVVQRSLPWNRQRDPVLTIVYLSRLLALDESTWGERASYLALLLFSGYDAKLWEEAKEGLPATLEGSRWDAFRKVLREAEEEGAAILRWRRIQDAAAAGERILAYRLAKAFEAGATDTWERHAEALEGLMDRVAAEVPDVAGGRWVREAAGLLDRDPAAALRLLTAAKARFGRSDFPEASRIAQLQRDALQSLPQPDWLNRLAEKHPLTALLPFGSTSVRTPQAMMMALYLTAMEQRGRRLPRIQQSVELLEGPCLLQMGDWQAAAEAMATVQETDLEKLPVPLRASVAFAEACLKARFERIAAESALSTLKGSASVDSRHDTPRGLLGRILVLEYGLFHREVDAQWLSTVLAAHPLPEGTLESRARLLLNTLTSYVQTDAEARALQLIHAVLEDEERAENWGIGTPGTDFLERVRGVLEDGEDADQIFSGNLGEGQLALAVSVALARGALSDTAWLKTTETLELIGDAMGYVGGAAVYEALLSCVGQHLAKGALPDAYEAVRWARSRTYPCLIPFYARLCFLRWGLLALVEAGGGYDLQQTLRAAECASEAERTLGGIYLDQDHFLKARQVADASWETRFWSDWMVLCRRSAHGNGDGHAAPRTQARAGRALPPGERLLLEGTKTVVEKE